MTTAWQFRLGAAKTSPHILTLAACSLGVSCHGERKGSDDVSYLADINKRGAQAALPTVHTVSVVMLRAMDALMSVDPHGRLEWRKGAEWDRDAQLLVYVRARSLCSGCSDVFVLHTASHAV